MVLFSNPGNLKQSLFWVEAGSGIVNNFFFEPRQVIPFGQVCHTECDVPVPGIPVPGNLSFYLMVSEPVSEKFGTEKSLGTGLEKNLVPKKVSEPVPKKFGTEKCPGIGLGKKLVPKKVS